MKHIMMVILVAVLVLVGNYALAQHSVQEVSKVAATAQSKLALNQASVEQLTAIPGLGKVKAEAIVAYIAEYGAISSEAELTKVKGVGEKLAARVAQYVSFE